MALTIRPLTEDDLPRAGEIIRLAFGTFLGVPDLASFWADLEYARTRWLADPSAAFGAEIDGELVGSNFATCWGSVGFFGPLSVRPDLWDQGVGQQLMPPIIERFAAWGVQHAGLFTFAHSPKHLGLYQKYGFWPRFLTAIMSKPIEAQADASVASCFSMVSVAEQDACLQACREVTNTVYAGLDVSRDIRAATSQGLGDTVLLSEGGTLAGLAVCHWGPGTEAGEGKCYIKFGAVRSGPAAGQHFERLLDACEALAARQGMQSLEAGVSMGRHEAYRSLLGRGFRTYIQGVTMHRPNESGYSRPGVYALDDWR